MPASIHIQKAEVNSFDAAFCLMERFFREEGLDTPAQEMRASLRTMLTAPGSAVFLAWSETEAVGVATVTTSEGIEYGRCAELEDLYVLPKARGSGVASALIEAVCVWCVQKRATVVLVTVTPKGMAEHNLLDYYQRRGFVNTGRIILERTLGDDRRSQQDEECTG
jgi:GNAT superfamily N-acetyltransferase